MEVSEEGNVPSLIKSTETSTLDPIEEVTPSLVSFESLRPLVEPFGSDAHTLVSFESLSNLPSPPPSTDLLLPSTTRTSPSQTGPNVRAGKGLSSQLSSSHLSDSVDIEPDSRAPVTSQRIPMRPPRGGKRGSTAQERQRVLFVSWGLTLTVLSLIAGSLWKGHEVDKGVEIRMEVAGTKGENGNGALNGAVVEKVGVAKDMSGRGEAVREAGIEGNSQNAEEVKEPGGGSREGDSSGDVAKVSEEKEINADDTEKTSAGGNVAESAKDVHQAEEKKVEERSDKGVVSMESPNPLFVLNNSASNTAAKGTTIAGEEGGGASSTEEKVTAEMADIASTGRGNGEVVEEGSDRKATAEGAGEQVLSTKGDAESQQIFEKAQHEGKIETESGGTERVQKSGDDAESQQIFEKAQHEGKIETESGGTERVQKSGDDADMEAHAGAGGNLAHVKNAILDSGEKAVVVDGFEDLGAGQRGEDTLSAASGTQSAGGEGSIGDTSQAANQNPPHGSLSLDGVERKAGSESESEQGDLSVLPLSGIAKSSEKATSADALVAQVGRWVGPFDDMEEQAWTELAQKGFKRSPVSGQSSEVGQCRKEAAFSHWLRGLRIVVVMHEGSLTGAPLAVAELAGELIGCGASVLAVVLNRKGPLVEGMAKRGIKVAKGKGGKTWKLASMADFVVAGSAASVPWVEPYLAKYPARSHRLIWWLMENRREYYDLSKRELPNVGALVFIAVSQATAWREWSEEDGLILPKRRAVVPLSVGEDLARLAGIAEDMQEADELAAEEARLAMRKRVRRAMGLHDEKDILVACLSSINPGKGQLFLVKALIEYMARQGSGGGRLEKKSSIRREIGDVERDEGKARGRDSIQMEEDVKGQLAVLPLEQSLGVDSIDKSSSASREDAARLGWEGGEARGTNREDRWEGRERGEGEEEEGRAQLEREKRRAEETLLRDSIAGVETHRWEKGSSEAHGQEDHVEGVLIGGKVNRGKESGTEDTEKVSSSEEAMFEPKETGVVGRTVEEGRDSEPGTETDNVGRLGRSGLRDMEVGRGESADNVRVRGDRGREVEAARDAGGNEESGLFGSDQNKASVEVTKDDSRIEVDLDGPRSLNINRALGVKAAASTVGQETESKGEAGRQTGDSEAFEAETEEDNNRRTEQIQREGSARLRSEPSEEELSRAGRDEGHAARVADLSRLNMERMDDAEGELGSRDEHTFSRSRSEAFDPRATSQGALPKHGVLKGRGNAGSERWGNVEDLKYDRGLEEPGRRVGYHGGGHGALAVERSEEDGAGRTQTEASGGVRRERIEANLRVQVHGEESRGENLKREAMREQPREMEESKERARTMDERRESIGERDAGRQYEERRRTSRMEEGESEERQDFEGGGEVAEGERVQRESGQRREEGEEGEVKGQAGERAVRRYGFGDGKNRRRQIGETEMRRERRGNSDERSNLQGKIERERRNSGEIGERRTQLRQRVEGDGGELARGRYRRDGIAQGSNQRGGGHNYERQNVHGGMGGREERVFVEERREKRWDEGQSEDLRAGVIADERLETAGEGRVQPGYAKQRHGKDFASDEAEGLSENIMTKEEDLSGGRRRLLEERLTSNALPGGKVASKSRRRVKLLIGSMHSKSNKEEYVERIARTIEEAGQRVSRRILWANATFKVAPLYAAADIYVMNAQGIGETFGRVTVEAMAFGLPVSGPEWRHIFSAQNLTCSLLCPADPGGD
eukprot:TRINITY_DN3451_c0_g1_i4.p1 TRINITY_DN3451_c0_g1~~TRINITY_DN3451_c0_g1_i4.p1  ORF type:complete len:1726 (-),score=342.17 TRINITY_DN3451_c0_g1_i4:222-5399(-)